MTRMISYAEGDAALEWLALTDALAAGHDLPEASVKDVFLSEGNRTILNRSAWIKGLGMAVKVATIFPDNSKDPMIHGAVNLFSDERGTLDAILDFALVTKWKTAADSLLAARHLAREDSRKILIVGAGTVGTSLHSAYSAAFPDAEFTIWNRTADKARAFADTHTKTIFAGSLERAVSEADIVTCATMSTDPVIQGDWLRPGQHIDLIGAYRPDMREADDECLGRATLFVDSFATTIDHIGELKDPIARDAISRDDIMADFYDLDRFTRTSASEITLFKNGGGAHLDLMTAQHILDQLNSEDRTPT